LVIPTATRAHGDVHARIAALGEEIAHQPANATLYVRRGSLHALDESWSEALADFESARRADPGLSHVDFLVAKACVELEQNERAIGLLDSFLGRDPEHADGYLVRARAKVALRRTNAAVIDYTRAIALFERPAPNHYLERARVLVDAGRTDNALEGLRQGVADLGPLASLVELAVHEEQERGRYDEALRWADQLSPTVRRSPRWHAMAGDLARDAGQTARAESEYREAVAAIEALPPARQTTSAMITLRTHVAEELNRLRPMVGPPGAVMARRLGVLLGVLGVLALFFFRFARTRSALGPDPS
jgi:tetratricopeptide (TPR) repeat protein